MVQSCSCRKVLIQTPFLAFSHLQSTPREWDLVTGEPFSPALEVWFSELELPPKLTFKGKTVSFSGMIQCRRPICLQTVCVACPALSTGRAGLDSTYFPLLSGEIYKLSMSFWSDSVISTRHELFHLVFTIMEWRRCLFFFFSPCFTTGQGQSQECPLQSLYSSQYYSWWPLCMNIWLHSYAWDNSGSNQGEADDHLRGWVKWVG